VPPVGDVEIEPAERVLSITLDRPDRRNAVTAAMVQTIIEAVEAAAVDHHTRVVLLRASGDHFCAGFDLSGAQGEGDRPPAGHLQRGFPFGPHRLIQLLADVQLPVVVEVRGYAAGFGCGLALAGDFVVAGTSARFWLPFVQRGFTPDSGTTYVLPRLIGLARAKEMVLRGVQVDGETAAQWGLVTRCTPDGRLAADVDELVAELAGAATIAVGLAKRLLHANLEADLPAALQEEGIYEELAVRSDDFKEGMRAFRDRRPPDFTGR
jgi:2-(1,2-epoxy-1,2-dihydrophenyl)acetyl-CoA isomerase